MGKASIGTIQLKLLCMQCLGSIPLLWCPTHPSTAALGQWLQSGKSGDGKVSASQAPCWEEYSCFWFLPPSVGSSEGDFHVS